MRKRQAVLRFLTVCCALFLFGACNPSGNPVTGVSLAPENPSVLLGTTLQLQAVISPENAADKTVAWVSYEPSIADVDANGLVTPYAAGSATIMAVSVDGPRGTTTVTVISPVEGITLTSRGTGISAGAVINMAAGDSLEISAAINPAGVDQTVNWVSRNPAVATVRNGTINAVGAGDAVITVSSAIDAGKTAAFTIRVAGAAIPVTGITLNNSVLNLTIGGADSTLTAGYVPAATTQAGVTWSSSDPSVAAVSGNGTVHAVAAGSAVITAVSTANSSVFAACTVNVVSIVIPVTGITLDKAVLSLNKGETGVLAAAYTPAATTQTGIVWSSSDPSVAAVSGDGTVTAVAEGTAAITAASAANSSVFAACTVNVVSIVIPVTGIALDKAALSLNKGETGVLTAAYTPAATTQQGLTWSSSNPSVAAVSNNGTVTAVAEGTAAIIAASTANSSVFAACAVTVATPLTGISLSPNPLSIRGLGTTGSFTVTYVPADTTQTGVTWSSSNPSVAAVSGNGTVIAAAGGTATITAVSTVNGSISGTAAVNVVIPVTGIALNPTALSLYKGETGSLTVNYTPAATTQTGVIWSSSNTAVATVTNGTVAAVGAGDAVITATSAVDATKTANCAVTITLPPLTRISLTPAPLIIGVGTTGSFTLQYIPAATAQTGVTWSSDNTSVATVDSNTGVIIAVAVGTANITATSTVNSSISGTAAVNVVIPVTRITLDQSTLNLNKGGTGSLTVTYVPSNTTQTGVIWSSSNTAVAAVSGDGRVAAVGGGKATITAASAADSTITAECAVTVTAPITGLSLPAAMTLSVGGSGSLTVTYAPSDTTQKDVTWSSDNTSVAAVDSNTGVITTVAVGTANITATSTVNGSISGSCALTVKETYNAAEVTIVFEGFEDETITLTTAVDQGDRLVITAPSGFDRYLWYRNNEFIEATSNPTATYPGSSPGRHNITVIVEEGGRHFSKTLIYKVRY